MSKQLLPQSGLPLGCKPFCVVRWGSIVNIYEKIKDSKGIIKRKLKARWGLGPPPPPWLHLRTGQSARLNLVNTAQLVKYISKRVASSYSIIMRVV